VKYPAAAAGPEALPGWRPGERVGHSSPQQGWGVFWNILINYLSQLSYQPFNNYKETHILPLHGPAGTRIADAW